MVACRALWGMTALASVMAVLVVPPAIAATDQSTATHPRIAFTGQRLARAGKRAALPVPSLVDLQKADGSTIYDGPILLHSLSFGVSRLSDTSAQCEGVRFRPRSPSPLQTHQLYAAFADRAPLKVARLSGILTFQGHPRGRWTLDLKQAVISGIHTSLTNDTYGQDFTDDVTLSPRAMTLTIKPAVLGPGFKSTVSCH